MGKKDKKSNKFFDEDEEEIYMENTAEEFGTPPPPANNSVDDTTATNGNDEDTSARASQEPEVGNAADDFEDNGLMSALKRSKKKKDDTKKAEEDKAAADAAEAVFAVKSKKEKEKEKKEREKAKKKAQAERKKTAPVLEKKPKESSPGPEDADDSTDAASKTTTSTATKKKSGKSAIAAALQKQIAARKAAEDAQRQAEEEEQKRLEELDKQLQEEERLKEEARQKKKEKEKAKKEELRAAGKLLTKKQREQQALQEKRRRDLLNSGVKVEGLMGDSVEKVKKPVYGKKKPSVKKQPSEDELKPAEKVEEDTTAKDVEPVKNSDDAKAPVEEEEALLEDWEAALNSDGEVKENWDEDEEEEDQEVKEPKSVNNKEKSAEEEKSKEIESEKKPSSVVNEKSIPTTDGAAEIEQTALEKAAASAASGKSKTHINEKREERLRKATAAGSTSNLRSPICCILGHVDTGKTKLLDKVRQTNVQEGEAGGITQQIGATYFPIEAIEQKTKVMDKYVNVSYNVPGLLVIDTPGHESFTNLRSRGSSLCNIAILVVDIMHGLEPQTLESIRLLRDKKTPFVVALNKIDRLYDWEATPNNSFRDSFSRQKSSVQREFQDRLEKTKVAFAEQGLNSELYYQNKNLARTVSLVPTSAITGEGIPDLLYLLLELTQSRMSKQLMYLSELEATVLEVKVIEGLGTTIDVVLSNGILREGDRIVLCGQNGPIATNVRALLTPQPLRELRIKSAYVHNKEVKAALGVKIAANDLEKAVAGSRLLLVGPDDDEEELMDDVMDDLTGLLDSVDKSGQGVCVQASTLGSLEALLDFLKDMKIPVMAIAIGPVFKRDVMRASTMLEKAKEFAVMLCFDVKIDKEAEQYAQEHGIRIFSADIIYHLFDSFTEYQQKLLEQRKKDHMHEAVFPCILKTVQVINKRNPMIVGVDVVEGSLRIGTPISVVKTDPETNAKQILNLGTVVSLEVNHKATDVVRKGQTNAGVAMRLEATSNVPPTWGRHMDEKDPLYSHITRKSIDTLKDPAFRNDVPRDDWLLIKHLKPLFDIK